MAGVLVGQPFDTVKVRLQTTSSPMYRGVWHCLTSIVKHESPKGLFKGMSSPLIGLGFINAIVFGVEAQTIRAFGEKTTYTHFVSGAFAGAVQCIVCSPMELAKTQMQVQGVGKRTLAENEYKSSWDCIRRIHKGYGFRGCYRGMVLTLLRDTPAFGCYFATYDILMSTIFQVKESDIYTLSGIIRMLFAGGLAGIASWVLTYPVDVVKSRMQADKFENLKYHGIMDCIRKGMANEGSKFLYRPLNEYDLITPLWPTNKPLLPNLVDTKAGYL